MSLKILVYGWYNQGNLGDDLFIDAFRNLFPQFEFRFTDCITNDHLKDIDAVFLGGGSFLDESLKVKDESTFEELKKLKLFYLGVGSETVFHSTHLELFKVAKLIAIRSKVNLDQLINLNFNTIVIPDIIYSLPVIESTERFNKSILFVPNIYTVPLWDDSHCKHISWDFFKTEMSQLLDELIRDGYKVDFLPMCVNSELNDNFAAIEIVNRMRRRKECRLLEKPVDFQTAIQVFSRYEAVVTQRYHGAVLAELAGTPSLTIHHHDKLKNVKGVTTSYYGLSKSVLLEKLHQTFNQKETPVLPIDRDIFVNLSKKVVNLLE